MVILCLEHRHAYLGQTFDLREERGALEIDGVVLDPVALVVERVPIVLVGAVTPHHVKLGVDLAPLTRLFLHAADYQRDRHLRAHLQALNHVVRRVTVDAA